ncbi:MAG: carboxymuconolactone decarboxylase family protein [Gemmatimonadales bacterium]
MKEWIAYGKVAPDAMAAMRGLEEYVTQSGLEPALLDLLETRASHLNRCAYCVDMHTKDARARGESARRQPLRADHTGLRARDTEHKAAVALREYLAR